MYSEEDVLKMMRSMGNKVAPASKKIKKVGKTPSTPEMDDDLNDVDDAVIVKKLQKNHGAVKKGGSKKEFSKIITFTQPVAMKPTATNKRRFKVGITYLDKAGKTRQTTVRFGEIGRLEYVDDKDEAKRLATCNRLKNTGNPLHHNFWHANVLNHESGSVKEALDSIAVALKI